MSKTTSNYGLFIAEGTDLFNPLTQTNPTYEKIDNQMKKNSDNSITSATEKKTGTVHALVREVQNSSVIRFLATSDFESGDTFTVDGLVVSAVTTSGELLPNGAFVAGNSVIGVLVDSRLTLYVSVKPTSVQYAENAGSATNAAIATNATSLNGVSGDNYALKNSLASQSIINNPIKDASFDNYLDGSIEKNQIFRVTNSNANGLPVNSGSMLYVQLYNDSTYFSNVALCLHMDTPALYFNGYSSATSSWSGWKTI